VQLFHHYTTEIAEFLTLPGPVGRTWRDRIPQLAMSRGNEYLTFALLAVSAAFRVYRSPNDFDAQRLGMENYGACLQRLRGLNIDDPNINPCAALATTILLAWYEVLIFS
jgi:Fungal specific transcription factor domain